MTVDNLDLKKIIISEFNPKETSHETWEKYHQLNEKLFSEIYIKEQLPNRESVEKNLIIGNPDYNLTRFIVYQDDSKRKLIARFSIGIVKENTDFYNENKEIGLVEIEVDADFRRQGLGTEILRIVTRKLLDKKCKFFEVKSAYPSGMNFCQKFGAKITNLKIKNILDMKDVDWDIVYNWINEGQEKNPDVIIEGFPGHSEKNIERYCELLAELENDSPTVVEEGDQEVKEIIDPTRYREYFANLKKNNKSSYTFRSIEPDGQFSALTELFYSKINNPEYLGQGLTGVKKQYRGRGLAKWLKALMLVYIKENLPEAKYWITGNAQHNTAMLSINKRLGFKPYYEYRLYMFNIDELMKKL